MSPPCISTGGLNSSIKNILGNRSLENQEGSWAEFGGRPNTQIEQIQQIELTNRTPIIMYDTMDVCSRGVKAVNCNQSHVCNCNSLIWVHFSHCTAKSQYILISLEYGPIPMAKGIRLDILASTQEEPHICIATRTPASDQSHRLTPDLLSELIV